MIRLFLCLLLLVGGVVVYAEAIVDYVDPLIGTASRRDDESNSAAMQPFVGVPFGMWQWTAMTRLSELGRVSYSDSDRRFIGFVGTRQPAPWMGEYGQISICPEIGDCCCDYKMRGVDIDRERSVFTPYYCKVSLANGIIAEVTGSSRTAMVRFSFPRDQSGRIVIDASREFIAEYSDRTPKEGAISVLDGSRRRLIAWNEDNADAKLGLPLRNFRAKFRIEISSPFTSCGTYDGSGVRGDDGYQLMRLHPELTAVTGNVCGVWLNYKPSIDPIVVKISQSMIDDRQAADSMLCEAGDGFDFDGLRRKAKEAWSRQLSRIEVDADEDIRTIFYTALYHASQFPREFSEYGRYYSAFDDSIHNGVSYTSYSLWDTYRAEHALLALMASERVDDMMTALLQMYREGGWLPKWPNPSYTGIMSGAPAEVVLAEAYVKGFRGFDLKTAYEAVRKNALVPQQGDTSRRWADREAFGSTPETRAGLTSYMKRGYVACDETSESVSRTQDFGLADRAAAVLADAVCRHEEAEMFRKRSKNYRNLWNAQCGMFLPRRRDGGWKFTPARHWQDADYTEQTPETAIWGVPFDIGGLEELMGGRAVFVRRLDEYFATHFYGRKDGLSCHENETTHHIPYLYAAVGEHEKCAREVRRILNSGYSTERWGMEGNDDCGQMSAWYVFSALGFYPTDPTTGEYRIGSPIVRSATVRIGAPFDTREFRVIVNNQSPENFKVRSVRLNGKELRSWTICHSDILSGGILEFDME